MNHALALKIDQQLDKIKGVKRVYYIERELNDLEDRLWEHAARIAELQAYINGSGDHKSYNKGCEYVAEKLRERIRK